MEKADVWLFFSNVSFNSKTDSGYIAEIVRKAKDEYGINLEAKNLHHFHIVSGDINELYYEGKKIDYLPRYAIIRRYEIYLSRQLELMGVKVFNTSSSMTDARNKMKVHQLLANANIKTPKTVFTVFKNNYNNVFYSDIVNILGTNEFVLKWIYGSQGKHVYLVKSEEKFNRLLAKYKGRILCQEYIKDSFGKDIRAYVINGKFIGAAIRESDGHDFRSNLARGGEAKKFEYNDQIKSLAENAAKAVGLDICGVDILMGTNDYYICEVNALPGFKSIFRTSNIDEKDILVKLIRDKIDSENQLLKEEVKL